MDRRNPVTFALVAAGVVASGCAQPLPPPAPPPVPTPPGSLYYEENLQPPARPRIEILDLEDRVAPDRRHIVTSGTLVNRGNRATSELTVKVTGLNDRGQPVVSAYAQPATQYLPPGGGTTTFTATLENHPDVVRYHVEAIAR